MWYGWYLGLMGRFDESLKEQRRAQELDPLSDHSDFGIGATGNVNGLGTPLHVKSLRFVGRFDGATGKLLIDDASLTGEQASVSESIASQVAEIRKTTSLPIAVGFGISTPDQARQIASSADAVVVGSAIVKRIAEFGSDAALTTKVKAALAKDAGLGTAANVNVQSYRGVVQLNGFVNTQEQVRSAGDVAGRIEGVSKVDNNLKVKPAS